MRVDQETSTTEPEAGDEPVVVTRRQLDALLALAARVERLEAEGPVPEHAPTPPPSAGAPVRVGRRRALVGLAGAAAAGTAAALASSAPAAAGNGDPLVLGTTTNSAGSPTALKGTSDDQQYGFGVFDRTMRWLPGPTSVVAHANGQSFDTAFVAQGDDTAGAITAVSDGEVAVRAITSGVREGVRASSLHGAGVAASGPTNLWLEPMPMPAPPTTTEAGHVGHLRWRGSSAESALWACTVTGFPGTWRKIVGTDTAGAFHLLPTPRRVYDSRPGTTPTQGPKTPLPAGNGVRTLDLTHNASGVPVGATGVLLTLLLVGAAHASGHLTVWAAGRPKPQSNTMVWGGDAGRFTATAVSAVDASARVSVAASHATDLVVDVVGYYR